MKKVFLMTVCIIPSFLCSMNSPTTPSRSNSVPSRGNSGVLITGKMASRNKLNVNSDPIANPVLQRVRSQSQETIKFANEENARKIFPYHDYDIEDKK